MFAWTLESDLGSNPGFADSLCVILDDPFDLTVPPVSRPVQWGRSPRLCGGGAEQGPGHPGGPVPDTLAGMRCPAAAGKSGVHLRGAAGPPADGEAAPLHVHVLLHSRLLPPPLNSPPPACLLAALPMRGFSPKDSESTGLRRKTTLFPTIVLTKPKQRS